MHQKLIRIKQKWGKLDESWRFAIAAFLIARLFYVVWSWVILTIQPVAIHYIAVGDKTGVIFLSLQTSQAYGYLREVNGENLSFRSINEDTVMDMQTNSTWNIDTGTAINGYHKGFVLPLVTYPTDMFPYNGVKPYPLAWLGLWQRFDTNWYLSIANSGYGMVEGDFVFPPLFPLLIRLLKMLIKDAFLAGLFISHSFTLYALKLLYEEFAQWGTLRSTQQALIFMLVYPVSFFLFSAYTESLFLVLAILSMRCMRARSWLWAGFWIFCAILARLQGIALLFPLLYLMWKDRPFLRKPQHWMSACIAGSGFLMYLYLRSSYSQSNMISFSELRWHSHFVSPWEGYLYSVQTLLSGQFNYLDFLNWAVTTLFIILLVLGWKEIPFEYNIYVIFSILIMLTRLIETKPLNSMLRYSLTLFPLFFTLGFIGNNSWGRRIVIYTCVALNLFLSQEFFSWGWVA